MKKQLNTARKETHVVSVMIPRLETDAIRHEKDNRPLLHQKRRHRLTGRYPQKSSGSRGEKVLLEQEERFRAEISLVCIRHVIMGTLPCVSNYKSEPGCKLGDKCYCRHVEAQEKPSKKSKKGGAKDQLPCSRSLHNWVVCLKILIRENLFYGKKEYWDQITPSNSPGARRGTTQKIGKERVHREELSKSVRLTSAIRKVSTSSKILIKLRFTFLLKPGPRRRPLQKISRRTRIRG